MSDGADTPTNVDEHTFIVSVLIRKVKDALCRLGASRQDID